MTEQEKLPLVPAYDAVVERNKIETLQKPGDLTTRNGDIAVTRWGDLMLNDEDYSAFFKLVQTCRYNFPTLKVLFAAPIEIAQHRKSLEEELDGLFAQAATNSRHPMQSLDYDAYHRTNDATDAAEVSRHPADEAHPSSRPYRAGRRP